MLGACSGARGGQHAPSAEGPAHKAIPAPLLLEGLTHPDATGWGEAAGLRYLELVRGAGEAERPLPMLVMIHGLGDRPRRSWFEDLDVPVRVVLPQAPSPHLSGFSWFAFRAAGGDAQGLARGIERAAAQLAQALDLLQRGRPTRGKPVVAGFSQGGMLTYALSLHHPEVVGFALPISGMLPRPLWPKHKPAGQRFPRILGLHGDADRVVPIEPAAQLVEHLRALGFTAELRPFHGIGHRLSPPMDEVMHSLLTDALFATTRDESL